MAIFGKKDEEGPTAPAPKPPPAQRPRRAAPVAGAAAGGKRSFLGEGCDFKGDLRGEGSFECGGKFQGTIDVEEDLVIGQGGVANAQLKAHRITIEGRLEGNATGGEKVEVGASGHVEGDVRAPAVQFAEGAFFEGNVEMRRAKTQEPEVPPEPAAEPEKSAAPADADTDDDSAGEPESSDDTDGGDGPLPPGPGRLTGAS